MTIEAGHKDIRNLIIGDNSQFHIPIYQRTYTWEAKVHVEKLLNDIIEFRREYKDNSKAEYYIGNIIVKNQTRAFQQERVVIDGQQRITTTILILCAIRDIYLNKIKTPEANQAARNIAKALFSENDGIIKLKLNNMEYQSTLTTILTGTIDAIKPSDKITKYWCNYQYIYKKLLVLLENSELDSFVETLDKIKVVIIFLDDAQDENSVFESINSLGKPLSGSDLIKNFLFSFKNYQCTHAEEKFLTDIYTRSLESLFSKEDNIEAELEVFFRQYIAVKTNELVNQDPKIIYYSFKKVVGEIGSFDECKNWIIDITKWGIIYQTLKHNTHKDINQNFIGYLKSSFLTYATLLMDIVHTYSDVENGSVVVRDNDKEKLNSAIKKLVAYDVSRLLGGFPAKQITRFIPTIPKRIKANDPNYHIDYASAFEYLVTTTTEGYAQPSLNKLKRSVIDVDLYNRVKKQVLRFLVLLENEGKNELLSFEKDLKGCEVEHIMPQTLTPEWNVSAENHERYLHTLGNLSITFNNQDLSNKSFIEKREILRNKSRINLNNLLFDYNCFDENAIRDRSLKLLGMFASRYDLQDRPDAVPLTVPFTQVGGHGEINIFEADDPTHRHLEYAVLLGQHLDIREISKLYVAVIKTLFAVYPEQLLGSDVVSQIKLTDTPAGDRLINPAMISDTHYIESCYNNKDKFKKIKLALSACDADDGLVIKYSD
jgi:hypothetical protein